MLITTNNFIFYKLFIPITTNITTISMNLFVEIHPPTETMTLVWDKSIFLKIQRISLCPSATLSVFSVVKIQSARILLFQIPNYQIPD